MKKIIKHASVFFVLVFTHSFSCAQNTFKNVLNFGYYDNYTILPEDSNYLICSDGIGESVIKLSEGGNPISHKLFLTDWPPSPTGCYQHQTFTIEDSTYYSFTQKKFMDGMGIAFFSYNSKSNYFNWLKYYNGVYCAFNSFNLQSNKFYCSTASYDILPYVNPVVFNLDSVGNLLSSYRINPYYGTANYFTKVNSNSLIAVFNVDTIGACVSRFDTLGNVQWAKSYFRKNAAFFTSVQNSDGTITMIGSPDTISLWQAGGYYHAAPLFLMKIDTAGTVLWCKSYGDNNYSFTNLPIAQLKASSDGGYLICATIQNEATIDNDLIIIKTDANGDTLWTRTHGSSFSEEFGNDISETSDSGYIMAGYTNSTYQFSNGGYYIIKTDSLGMTATHCEEFNTPFAVNNITPNDSNITLSIITGVVTAGSSTVTDTTLALPPSVDGCTLNTINQPQGSYYNNKALSYSNPAQGSFKIKGTGNTAYKLTVTVYDTLGKQLFEKQYNSPDDIQIDLNNRGKGVYSVRIMDGENTKWSKVVVE